MLTLQHTNNTNKSNRLCHNTRETVVRRSCAWCVTPSPTTQAFIIQQYQLIYRG